jgi:hypothetical protein
VATPGTSPDVTAPTTSAFSGAEAVGGGAAAAGSSAAASAAPTMIGDQPSSSSMRSLIRLPNGTTTFARIPQAIHGAFKISENESPRPLDRVFINFNYFNNLSTFGGPNPDLYRETFGFEKTFLDGNASFGLCVPLLQKDGSAGGVGVDGFGDVTVIGKYAFINDRDTGNVLSGGLAVTAPTGRDPFPGFSLHSTLLQPWAGFIYSDDQFFVHGFSSLVVPTDVRDVIVMFNDIGVGYRAYKACDQAISAIIPTLEAHVTTPFNHRNVNDVVNVPDQVDLTAGVHVGLYNRAFLTLGGAVPVTGPKPFDFELIAQLNYRW